MTAPHPEGPLAVETISSYARRVEDQVRVVLHLPGLDYSGQDEIAVRFKGRHGTVVGEARATIAGPGTLLVTEVPARSLPPGIWRVAVRPTPEARFRRADARLMTSSSQPIALLGGPAPRGFIAPPQPVAPLSRRQRLAGHAGTLVDRGLAPMSRERADRYRAAVRRAARRLLG